MQVDEQGFSPSNEGRNAMNDIAKRVAARVLKAEGHVAEANVVAKLPSSKPGLQMVKSMLDDLNKAYDDEDADGFGKALETLYRSHDKINA